MKTLEHNRCRLRYRVAGGGPPVLLIQGVAVRGDGWLPQVEGLSPRYTCLSFDNRGIGESRPLGIAKLTVEAMAADALALADAEGWDSFHVVGHSMGGHIAMALALSAKERVRSLCLMCTTARGKDIPPMSPSFLWTSMRARIGTRNQRRRAFLEIVLPRAMREAGDLDAWAERLSAIFGHDLADSPPVTMKQVGAYRAFDATPRLGELADIPTLVVSASEDPLAPPRLGRALAGALEGARFHEVPGASHGVTATHAEETNRLIEEHLEAAPAH